MANKTIKGLTVEIGGDTTKLSKALEDVEKKGRDLSSELGEINKLLKLDPGNTDLLAQKLKVLAEAVSTTREKLDRLKEAEKQVQAQFEKGEASEEQVRALQREIIATEKKLGSYENAVKETAEAVNKLGDNSDKAADDVDDLGDSSDKAEKSADDLGGTLDGTLSSGLKAVAGLAAAASAAIIGAVEATHEYRTAMGKLDTAFATSGHNSEAATKTYKELQGVLGETDQAVEAASHLAKLADNEEDLEALTEALTGVYATFGASLPIEGLAEAANETAKVGKVTGSFADAINWAADENTDWKKILGTNTKALGAFEKAVKDGEAVEDAYTAALEACSNEQERQQLITETLTKLYGGAAAQYKKTNKAIIEANKANEDWTATLAEVGEEVQPLVTDIKKMGTEVLKSAKAPLKDVADFISRTVIPSLTSLSTWVLTNGPIIKATIVGATAAFVAYKVACAAATTVQVGLKAAIMATTVAQKALTLAQAATPWGLAAVAIAGVVTALIAYCGSTKEAAEDVGVLTEKERELMESANATAESFRDQQAATESSIGGISSQMGHVQKLADELQRLADKSGKVKESDEARAQFILNELNEALGTEYTMVDGVIQKYGALKNNIDAVIRSKTANAMLEAANADYVAALQAENDAIQNLVLSEKDYQAQKEVSEQKIREWEEEVAELRQKQIDGVGILTQSEMAALGSQINNLGRKINEEKKLLGDKKAAYDQAATDYGNYSNTIMTYEEAQSAALQGNYDKTVELLKKKGGNFGTYAEDVNQATRNTIDSLYKEAIDAGLEAERTRQNFENGVDGYTEQMVKEAEQSYEDALSAWATAYDSAHAVGTDLGGGLTAGMEGTRTGLIAKAKSIVQSIIGAFRKEADSHSPSRKMVDFGEDMGEGGEIGLENKTADMNKVARKQVKGLLDIYTGEDDDVAHDMLRSVAAQDAARQTQSYQTATNGTAARLDSILAAIERGQVLLLDGDALVGGTADRMNRQLGHLQLLTARGAI